MTKEASEKAFAAFEEELDKAETEQLERFKKLVKSGFTDKIVDRTKSIITVLKGLITTLLF